MSVFMTVNNGKQVWCASFSYIDDSGKRRFIRGYGETASEAVKRRSANVTKTMQSGMNASRRATSPKVADYLQTWLDSPALKKVGDETHRKYRRDIERHILPHIGTEPLEKLTDDRLNELFHSTLDNIGTSARLHTFKNFRIMLNHAVKTGVIQRNPLAGVNIPKHDSKVAVNDDRYNDARLRMAPYYLKWLGDPENEFHDHFNRVVFMFLGLRRSEILGLEWSCINNLTKKDKASFVVRQQLARHEKHTGNSGWYLKDTTKGKRPRTIPLPEIWRLRLLDEKRKNRKAQDEWASDLIFLTPNGAPTSYNLHLKKWNESLNAYMTKDGRAMIDGLSFRPHAVRHLTASLMFANGVPLEVAQDILGHSDKAQTQHYTHLTRPQQKAATDALVGFLT